MKRVLVTGGAGFIGSHVAEALLSRGHEVTVLDDLSGGFSDNVPGGARFIQASRHRSRRRRPHLRRRAVRLRLPPRRLRRRRPQPLHQAVQLHEQRHRQRQPDQRLDQHRRQGLRLHLVDRGLRPEPGRADDRRGDSRARRSVRHRQVRRRARAGREPDAVRARLHDLPAAQRLRPAPEHRRSLSQRRRHLHEPDPAGPADDDLRRRHADARLQLHRRRGAGDGGGARRTRRVEPGVQRRRRRALAAQRPRRARRPRDGRRLRASPTFRRGTKSTRALEPRQDRARAWPSRTDTARRRPRVDGRVGEAAGRAVEPGVRGHRGDEESASELAER